LSSVNDSITRAMKALGHLGRTEVPTGQEFTDCLYAYNQLLESWSTEKLMSYATLQRSFSLVANTQSYTQAFVRDSNGQDFPLTIVSREVWNTIGLKSTTSDIPQILFYDSTYPLGVVYIYPVPTQALTVFYDSTLNQVTASTGTTSISMPPGYERCFISNLALELMANGFPCLLNAVQLSALTKAASDGIANIKRANIKEVLAACDEAIVSQPIATYNPYTNQ
jgi:hypothetical protein